MKLTMQEADTSQSPRDIIREGLRILAKIIAREVINGQPAKTGELLSNSPSPGAIHARFANITEVPDSTI
jgi:hypothetical protein